MTRKQAIMAIITIFFGGKTMAQEKKPNLHIAGSDRYIWGETYTALRVNLDVPGDFKKEIGLSVTWRGKTIEYTMQELWDAIKK